MDNLSARVLQSSMLHRASLGETIELVSHVLFNDALEHELRVLQKELTSAQLSGFVPRGIRPCDS